MAIFDRSIMHAWTHAGARQNSHFELTDEDDERSSLNHSFIQQIHFTSIGEHTCVVDCGEGR